MVKSLALITLLALASACANTGAATDELRFRRGQTIVSRADPAIRVSVDRELPFLGETDGVVMDGRATMHQYWFAEIEGGQLERAVIVHFEHMNEGSDISRRSRIDPVGGSRVISGVWGGGQAGRYLNRRLIWTAGALAGMRCPLHGWSARPPAARESPEAPRSPS
jgi:hypothetical protein